MAELYTLPDGWEWKKLEKLAKLQNGFAFKSNLFVNEGLPIVRIKNIKNEKVLLDDVVYFNVEDYGKKLDSYQIKKNDILLAMSGATTGKIGLYDTDEISYLNQRVGLFRIENSNLRSYLFYFLSTQIEKNLELSLGAAQPNLSTEQINNIELPLPPLEEQKRIVDKLDILFAKIDKAIALHQKNIDEANVFMASVLNDVFVELEEKYPIKTLNDVCDKITDGTHSSPKTTESGYPYITVRDVTDKGKIDFDNCEFVNEIDFQRLKDGHCAPIENDVLFSKDGTVGKVTVVDFQKDFVVLSSLAILRPSNDLNSYFLFYTMKSPKFFEFAQSQKTGAAIKRVVLRTIKEFEIPFPVLPIQQKVVSYLDEISQKMEKIKQIQKEKMQSLKALKASILDQAFRGEL